jgi:membrane protein DedA with SNARE-associated domain
MLHFEEWISSYGYLGIFLLLMLGVFGLPIPDEPLLIFSGYLIFRGRLHPAGALLAGFAGSSLGISISYSLGRLLGLRVVVRYGRIIGLTHDKVARIHGWFMGIGHWVLMLGYFAPGIRHLTAIVAGISKLEIPLFMLFAYAGAFLWVSTFLAIGYYFGERWGHISDTIHSNLVLTSYALGVLIFCYFCGKWLLRNRSA